MLRSGRALTQLPGRFLREGVEDWTPKLHNALFENDTVCSWSFLLTSTLSLSQVMGITASSIAVSLVVQLSVVLPSYLAYDIHESCV